MDHKAFDNELVRMSDVTLAGYTKLTYEERLPIIEFVMNRQNWAKLTVRKLKASAKVNDSNQPLKIAPPLTNGAAGPSFSGPPASSHSSSALVRSNATTGSIPSNELIIVKPRFELPLVRNENRGILAGKTIVLTGTFPEVGGGFGLNLGKDKTRAMIEKFGGRVTSAVSGKTDLLITGTKYVKRFSTEISNSIYFAAASHSLFLVLVSQRSKRQDLSPAVNFWIYPPWLSHLKTLIWKCLKIRHP